MGGKWCLVKIPQGDGALPTRCTVDTPPPRAFLGFPPSSPSAVPPRSLSDSATETLTPVSLHWVQEGAVACQPLSAGHRGGRQGLGEFDEWEQDMEKVPD